MKKKVSFEQAMGRLEEIVAQLEGGNVSLDSSLKLYEEGTALIRLCSETLDQAELKMKTILKQDAREDSLQTDIEQEEEAH